MVDSKDKKRISEAANKRGYSVRFDDEKLKLKKQRGFDKAKPAKKEAKPKSDPMSELVKDVVETNKQILEKMDKDNVVPINTMDTWSTIKVKVARHESGKYKGTIDYFILEKITN